MLIFYVLKKIKNFYSHLKKSFIFIQRELGGNENAKRNIKVKK